MVPWHMSTKPKEPILKVPLVAGLLEITFKARSLELYHLLHVDRCQGHVVDVRGPQNRRRSGGRGGGGRGVLRLYRVVAEAAIAAGAGVAAPRALTGTRPKCFGKLASLANNRWS